MPLIKSIIQHLPPDYPDLAIRQALSGRKLELEPHEQTWNEAVLAAMAESAASGWQGFLELSELQEMFTASSYRERIGGQALLDQAILNLFEHKYIPPKLRRLVYGTRAKAKPVKLTLAEPAEITLLRLANERKWNLSVNGESRFPAIVLGTYSSKRVRLSAKRFGSDYIRIFAAGPRRTAGWEVRMDSSGYPSLVEFVVDANQDEFFSDLRQGRLLFRPFNNLRFESWPTIMGFRLEDICPLPGNHWIRQGALRIAGIDQDLTTLVRAEERLIVEHLGCRPLVLEPGLYGIRYARGKWRQKNVR